MNVHVTTDLRLTRRTLADLLAHPFEPREFIIEPWLRNGETALIWAGSGVGKTMLTLSLALAMAGGGQVWEWKCTKPRKVLIIDGEMHLQDLQERIKLLAGSAVQDLDLSKAAANLSIVARQDQSPDSVFYDVTNIEHQQRIMRRCTEIGAEVLIIDNLSTVADGLADENDATAFRSVQAFMLKMKQAGITTILVHHARKDGAELRGSTALATTFEVILGLKKPKVRPQGKACFVAVFDKFRAQGGNATASRTWTLGETGWAVEEDPEDEMNATLAAIQSLRFTKQKEVAEALGITPGALTKRIQKLIAAGMISEDGVKEALGKARRLRMADELEVQLDVDPKEDPEEAY